MDWEIDRRCINDEDEKVIVDLPSGERVEVTYNGSDPVVQLFTIDGFQIELVPA
jgi:hypothetical protein